jgi:hypothetical protein
MLLNLLSERASRFADLTLQCRQRSLIVQSAEAVFVEESFECRF